MAICSWGRVQRISILLRYRSTILTYIEDGEIENKKEVGLYKRGVHASRGGKCRDYHLSNHCGSICLLMSARKLDVTNYNHYI